MFDLTVERQAHADLRRTTARCATATQALYRLDNADVPAASLVTGSGADVANTGAWIRLSSDDAVAARVRPAGASARASASTTWSSPCPRASPTRWSIGGVATPTFGEATHAIDRRRRELPRVLDATRRTRATPATSTCARSCSTRRTPTSRSSDPTAASSATTARSRTSAAGASSCSTTRRSARRCCRRCRRGSTS